MSQMPSMLETKPQKKSAPKPGEKVKLNKSTVDLISEPGIYHDSELTGFRLRVGSSGVKSYLMVGKAKGAAKPVYVTIGRHGDPWTADTARAKAVEHRLTLRQGNNPNALLEEKHAADAEKTKAERAQKEVRQITLGAAFAKHIQGGQKDSTIRGYQKVINAHLKSWMDKSLIDINQSDVGKLFDLIEDKSPSSAAHAMRLLKAVFKTAQVEYGEEFPELASHNPTLILSRKKGWNAIEPRQDYICDEDLPAFYNAVMKLESQTAKDYLMVCILTGLRLGEACSLTWVESDNANYVDLNKRVITICSEGAKNRQRHMLAMSDYLYALFLRRWQTRENNFVFPGKSAEGHFSNPKASILNVVTEARIPHFKSHSLRRTFATAADAVGYDLRSIQRLLNHKPGSVADRHYIQRHAEKTKEPMQRINDHLLKLMTAEVGAEENVSNVVPLTIKTVTG
ncbi:MAG: hypothetical protein C0508_00935 [Cyanobacteria bacterium PR.023]|nr:hypothetical protein [Cyanobacteria bacterium PR.3.49]MBA4073571.1 hypothetical protein [Cyanobacteria bacterium PR.023]